VTHAPTAGQEFREPYIFHAVPSWVDQNAAVVVTHLLKNFDGTLRVLDVPASFYLVGRR
jgi:hypothetical protein